MRNVSVYLIHGNGGGTASDHWFPQLIKFLQEKKISVIARDFPDNEVAHQSIWIPFLEHLTHKDPNTILVGHSSGAVAAMRYAEKTKLIGSVLVGADYTDLGDANEKASGYFTRPWNWAQISKNQNWIIQFASKDDPYIPVNQPRFIHKKLGTEYYEFQDRGHFMVPHFPEIADKLWQKLQALPSQ